MAGNAVRKRQKAPQKIELGLAIFLDLNPALGTAQHPHQRTQQQLRQRVEHLRLLPRIRQLLEKLKPAQPMTNRSSHRKPPPTGDS